MKYQPQELRFTLEQRQMLNTKVLYLINRGACEKYGITHEDIYNAYTGIGGLHGLNRGDFDNYHVYSEKKKQFEGGQFFTPPKLCELVISCLHLSEYDLVADLTCGMGNFFNYAPAESNAYGCELDLNAYKVARYLYPAANLVHGDIRTYFPSALVAGGWERNALPALLLPKGGGTAETAWYPGSDCTTVFLRRPIHGRRRHSDDGTIILVCPCWLPPHRS